MCIDHVVFAVDIRYRNTTVMAKVGLDAICAKLSRNAEVTSREVEGCTPTGNNNNDVGGGDDGVVSSKTAELGIVDEDRRSAALGRQSASAVTEHENIATGNEPVTLKSAGGGASLIDSGFGEETASDGVGDSADDVPPSDAAGACRRSRRKNFLPRCVQDGLSEPRQSATDTATTTTTSMMSSAVENSEDDQVVLDLRTGPSSSAPTPRQTGDQLSSSAARKSSDDAQDQVLDLTVPRYGRGPLGSDDVRRAGREPTTTGPITAGRPPTVDTAANMRIHAAIASTMTELMRVYGLPGDFRSIAAGLRKRGSPDDNGAAGGRADVRPLHLDVARSAGRTPSRERIVTTTFTGNVLADNVDPRRQGHGTEPSHVTGM